MFIRLENKERECDEMRAEVIRIFNEIVQLIRLKQQLLSNQNKNSHSQIDNEKFDKNTVDTKEVLDNQDKKQGAIEIANKISELKVDQIEEKSLKNPEINSDVKERNINTKSLVR